MSENVEKLLILLKKSVIIGIVTTQSGFVLKGGIFMNKNVYREFHVARYVKLHVEKLKKNDRQDWTVKYPRNYMKELKREQDNLKKAIKDLIFLINEAGFDVYDWARVDVGYFTCEYKKYKFNDFIFSDFEYIKKLQYKMQDSNPEIEDIEPACKQLVTLQKAKQDVEMAFYLYLDYFLEK